MLEKSVTITLEKAKEWYNSGNATLKEVALQAFSEKELEAFDFTEVKTFDDALRALDYSEWDIQKIDGNIRSIYCYNSKASAAMFKLNFIRKALHKETPLYLTKNTEEQGCIWFPYFRLMEVTSSYYKNEIKNGTLVKIGKIQSDGKEYFVLSGDITYSNKNGIGQFYFNKEVGEPTADLGFLGCATKGIAKHLGLYFGMLIVEAMYGDLSDFTIIESLNEKL